MSTIRSFVLGMIEFRSCVTSHVDNIDAYDWGREIAHRITLYRFDPCSR